MRRPSSDPFDSLRARSNRGRAHTASRHRGLGRWHEVGQPGEPAFNGSWDRSAANTPVIFMVDDFGLVHLAGNASKLGGGTQTIFVLPPRFRPQYRSVFLVVDEGPQEPARLDVYASGSVVAANGVSGPSLADVQFRKAPADPGEPEPEGLYPASDLYPADDLYPGG